MKLTKVGGLALLGCGLQPMVAAAQDMNEPVVEVEVDRDVDVDVNEDVLEAREEMRYEGAYGADVDVDIDIDEDDLERMIEDRYAAADVRLPGEVRSDRTYGTTGDMGVEREGGAPSMEFVREVYPSRDWEARFGTFGTHGERMISDLEIARRYGWSYFGNEPNYSQQVAVAEARIEAVEASSPTWTIASYGRTIGLTDAEVREQIALGSEGVAMTSEPMLEEDIGTLDVTEDTVVYSPVDEDLDGFVQDDLNDPFGLDVPMDRDLNNDGVIDENDVYDWDGDGIPG